jgi:hypothetical protein
MVIDAMARGIEDTAPVTAEPEPDRKAIVFRGDFDAVYEHFLDRNWSDGLPIIPPTVAKIERFLRHTSRDADDVVGRLLPANTEADVWSIAVNGVMAGCKPEYMPVLVAIVEAISDPHFRIQDAGSTPGWEPLVIVSGPAAERLGFHHGTGVLRVGNRANTTVGRFLRLYMRNVAGLLIPPGGVTDKATFGSTFNVAMAENETAALATGWNTFGTDRGFTPGESVVTVTSVESVTPPIYTRGASAESHLRKIAEMYGGMASHWTCCGLAFGGLYGVLAVSPAVAEVFGRDGLTKRDIQQYLYDNCRVDIDRVHSYAADPGNEKLNMADITARRPELKPYADAGPGEMVPVFPWPEFIDVIVSGDPDRNQSKGFLNNHCQGAPVSRAVTD